MHLNLKLYQKKIKEISCLILESQSEEIVEFMNELVEIEIQEFNFVDRGDSQK